MASLTWITPVGRRVQESRFPVLFAVGVHGIILLLAALLSRHQGVETAACHWDCEWYTAIARSGYDPSVTSGAEAKPGQGPWAFFPLFPMAVRTVSVLVSLHATAAALLLNAVLVPVMLWFTFRWASLRTEVISSRFFCLFFLLYPFGLWFRLPYSETAYGLLLMACMVLLEEGAVLWAACVAALLTATRPTGVLVVFILAIAHFARTMNDHRASGRSITAQALMWTVGEVGAFVSIGLSGLAAYMLYLHHVTGDALAFSHIQSGWHRHFSNPITHILDGIYEPHAKTLVPFAVIEPLIMVWGAVSGLWLESIVLFCTWFLSVSTGLNSIYRIVPANPLMIFILWRGMSRFPMWAQVSVLSVFILIDILFGILWINGKSTLA